MNIEGDTLFYADVNSDKYSALHGSNVERLEVVNSAQLWTVSVEAWANRFGQPAQRIQ